MEPGNRGSYLSYEESGSSFVKYGPRPRKRNKKSLAENNLNLEKIEQVNKLH